MSTLIPYSQLSNCAINETNQADGNPQVGTVDDVLFDSLEWVIRYLVVDTGKWLPGRRVLLPPLVLHQTDWRAGLGTTSLTREQVKQSPDINTRQPISRRREAELMGHYRVPYYWGPAGGTLAGGGPPMLPLGTDIDVEASSGTESSSIATSEEESHLRSASEVQNYTVHASDDDIGHVEDFVFDQQDWSVRYLVVDTRNWLPGRKVLVAVDWIEEVRWDDVSVSVNLTRDEVKRSPKFDPTAFLERDYEENLHQHYGRNGYWMM